MSNQPNDASSVQKADAQQYGNTNKMGQQQRVGSTGISEGDATKSDAQKKTSPPAKTPPANQPSGMPNPI